MRHESYHDLRIENLTDTMRDICREHAPGSECACWQAFVEDCANTYGLTPWAMIEKEKDCTDEFASRWPDPSMDCATDQWKED